MTEKEGEECCVQGFKVQSFGLGEWERDCVSIEKGAQSVCEDLQWVKTLE